MLSDNKKPFATVINTEAKGYLSRFHSAWDKKSHLVRVLTYSSSVTGAAVLV